MRYHSDFPFNGERDYVHGPTMLDAFRRAALETAKAAEGVPVKVRLFRVNQLVQANATIAASAGTRPAVAASRPWAEMVCMVDGAPIHVGLYDIDRTPVTERRESLEKTFIDTVELTRPFSGHARLHRIATQYDLIQAVVEANKQLHLLTVPADRPRKFRFVYCLDYECPTALAGNGTVTICNLGVQETDTHSFTLNLLHLDLGGHRARFRIAFGSTDIKDYTMRAGKP